MAFKIGTGMPATDLSVAEAARYIEEVGFESMWVPDLVIGDGSPALDPTLLLAGAATVTDRVGIGFSVLTLALRPVAWVAVQIATLQHLSGNRVLLGVGAGGFPDSPFWQAVGVRGTERGRRTDATLDLLPRLLSGEPTQLNPHVDPLTIAPAVAMPPLLIGGNSEAAMRRVLRYGGDWFPSLISPDDLAISAAQLRNTAAQKGLRQPGITVGGHLFLGDDESNRAAVDAFVQSLIDDHGMSRDKAIEVPIRARNAAELAEVFGRYQEAGADRIVAGPDTGDWKSGLEMMVAARDLLA
jgi:alkanesulfonate monooxygenase SsuD/methylene tetrahydromethanopterin reductase-like flavin-dependent oxidoreductase (luciferase family)